jgi:hypothetical protein
VEAGSSAFGGKEGNEIGTRQNQSSICSAGSSTLAGREYLGTFVQYTSGHTTLGAASVSDADRVAGVSRLQQMVNGRHGMA